MGPGGPLSLTLIPVEALDEWGAQGLVDDLTGVQVVTLIVCAGQRQDAAQAVCVVLAVLLRLTVLDAAVLDNIVHLPLDTDILGVEGIQRAQERGSPSL